MFQNDRYYVIPKSVVLLQSERLRDQVEDIVELLEDSVVPEIEGSYAVSFKGENGVFDEDPHLKLKAFDVAYSSGIQTSFNPFLLVVVIVCTILVVGHIIYNAIQ
jgi:hypothetical protein